MTYPFIRMGAAGMIRCGGVLPPTTYANADVAKNRKSMVFDPAIKPYLEFDQVDGDPTKYTFFATIKKANLYANRGNKHMAIMGSQATAADASSWYMYFNVDSLYAVHYNRHFYTTAVLGDTSAWYSIMMSYDNGNAKFFVNGKQLTGGFNPTGIADPAGLFIKGKKFCVGKNLGLTRADYNEMPFDGQMTMVGCIDGVALPDMSALGDFDKDTGEWVPKDPDTTGWRNNSFYLSGKEEDTTDFVQTANWDGAASQKLVLNPSDNERVDWALAHNPTNGYYSITARVWEGVSIALQRDGAVDNMPGAQQWGARDLVFNPADPGWPDLKMIVHYGPAGAKYGINFLKYTGNGMTQSLPHGLGKKPAAVWIKRHDTGMIIPWWEGFNDSQMLRFNMYEQSIFTANSRLWVNAEINDTVFTVAETNGVADQTLVNAPGVTYYAVFFTSVPGYMDVGTAGIAKVADWRNFTDSVMIAGKQYTAAIYRHPGVGASTKSLYEVVDGKLNWLYEFPINNNLKTSGSLISCDNGKNYAIFAGDNIAGSHALEVWEFTPTSATRVFGTTGVAHNYNDVKCFRQGSNYYAYTAAIAGADIGSIGGCVLYLLNPDTGALTRQAVASTAFSNGVNYYEVNGKTYLVNNPAYAGANGNIFECNGSSLTKLPAAFGKDIGTYVGVYPIDGEIYITAAYGASGPGGMRSYVHRVIPSTGLLAEVCSVPIGASNAVLMRRKGKLVWIVAHGNVGTATTYVLNDNPADPNGIAKIPEEIGRTGMRDLGYVEIIKKFDTPNGKALLAIGGMAGNNSKPDGFLSVQTFNDDTLTFGIGGEIPFKPALSIFRGINNGASKSLPDSGWLQASYDHGYGTALRAFPGAYNTPSMIKDVVGDWEGATKYSYTCNLQDPHVYIRFADRTYTTTFERTPTPLGRLFSRTQDDTLEMSYDHPLNNVLVPRINSLPDTAAWGGFGVDNTSRTTAGAIGYEQTWVPGTYAEYTVGEVVRPTLQAYVARGQPTWHVSREAVDDGVGGYILRELNGPGFDGLLTVAIGTGSGNIKPPTVNRINTPTPLKVGDVIGVLRTNDDHFHYYQNGVLLYRIPISKPDLTFKCHFWLDIGPGHVAGIHQTNFGTHPWVYPPADQEFVGTGKADKNLDKIQIIDPKKFFRAVKHIGTGDDKPNTVIDIGWKPSFCLYKDQTVTGYWILFDDALPGKMINITTNEPLLAKADGGITNSGLQTGAGSFNVLGHSYTLMAWQASPCSGVYHGIHTRPNGGITIQHGLGRMPKMVWIRALNVADHTWCFLNRGDGRFGIDYHWFDAGFTEKAAGTPAFTCTDQSLSLANGAIGQQFAIYIFAEVPGFSAFGFHIGTGNSTGWDVGFRPAVWVSKENTGEVRIVTRANNPANPVVNVVFLNTYAAMRSEAPYNEIYNFTSRGVFPAAGSGNYRDHLNSKIDEWAFADCPWEVASATV